MEQLEQYQLIPKNGLDTVIAKVIIQHAIIGDWDYGITSHFGLKAV